MNKTIKVIDLLNKIANIEEIPEKIKYNGTEYKLNEITGWYQSIDVIGNVDEWFISKYKLNDKVEIIEDKEDINIQDIEEITKLEKYKSFDTRETISQHFNKINKIIQQQNKLVQAVKHLEKTKEDK